MFAHATPSPSTLSTSNDPASPTTPSRSSRLRGLSYLRYYTHSHLSSESNQAPSPSSSLPSSARAHLVRSTSHPTRVSSSDDRPDPQQTLSSGAPNPRLPSEFGLRSSPAQTSSLPTASADPATGQSSVNSALGGISRIMARRRSGGTPQGTTPATRGTSETASTNLTGYPLDQMPTIKLIPHQDPRSGRPSLVFPQTSRTLPHEDCVIRVGRYSERDSNPNPPLSTPSSAPVGFKSKVVSRRHCEFWCSNGQWYIKDVKSSSGTFLNHIRLSQPSVESRPWPVNDGDVVQLGIDFRGGEEMIFRCVKIRVECNRGWQKTLNNFNLTTHKRLRDLGKVAPKKDSDTTSTHSSECSICLMSIAPCQSLFVAPCSHVWHYKCIRPILNDHKSWPQFLCPNCRAVADLEADVDDPDAFDEDWEDEENGGASSPDAIDTPETNGDPEQAQPVAHDGDQALATVTSRLSSIRVDPESSSSSRSDSNEHSIATPTLLTRRNARRVSPPYANRFGVPTPARSEDTAAQIPEYQNYLRPITPTQPLLQDGDLARQDDFTTHLGTPTPTTSDMLASDGPMTPTNNAGPFVFDGSAGRAAGRRATASLSLTERL